MSHVLVFAGDSLSQYHVELSWLHDGWRSGGVCSDVYRKTASSLATKMPAPKPKHIEPRNSTGVVLIFTVFRDESVVASRLSSSCTQKTHHQCQNVYLIGCNSCSSSVRRKVFSLNKQRKKSLPKKKTRIEDAFQLVRITHDICTGLPSQPSLLLQSILMGESANAATVARVFRTDKKENYRRRQIETQLTLDVKSKKGATSHSPASEN